MLVFAYEIKVGDRIANETVTTVFSEEDYNGDTIISVETDLDFHMLDADELVLIAAR